MLLKSESNAASARKTLLPSVAADVINLCMGNASKQCTFVFTAKFLATKHFYMLSNTNSAALMSYIESLCFSLSLWLSNLGSFASVSLSVLHIHSMKQLSVVRHSTLDDSAISFAFQLCILLPLHRR